MSLALSSVVPNFWPVEPLRPTAKSQDQGQLHVTNTEGTLHFTGGMGAPKSARRRVFVLEVILLKWNFIVEFELGLSYVTVHVCTLPPDNQKDGSGDAHVTQAQRFEITYVQGVTIQNKKHLGGWQPGSSALCGFQAVLATLGFHLSTQT